MSSAGSHFFDIGYMDMLASGDSVLHRLDPRAKLITTFLFIAMVVSFDRYTFSGLIVFFVFPVIQMSLGRLPAAYLLRKALLVSPFAALIAIFNPVIDREVLFYLGTVGVTSGWISFFSIMTRFLLTVLAALTLVATTGFNDVCASLSKLGTPRPLVVQLMFLYRYLFVLTADASRMVRAVSLRSFTSSRIGLTTVVPLLGHLLLRTMDRSQRVHMAMLSRGFDGHIRFRKSMHFGGRELLYVSAWSLIFCIFRWYNIPRSLGTFVTGMF